MEFVIGIVCGVLLSLIFSVGPAFFALIQNSIHHGFKKATWFAAGVSLSDAVVVVLMLTVLKNIDFGALMHNVWVAGIGGVAIAVFGVRMFRSKVRRETSQEGRLRFAAENATRGRELLLSGFLLNILNPTIWLYWLTIITFISSEMNLGVADRYEFFAGMMLAVFATDVLKCRLAAMMQSWFTARRLNLFNKLMGSVLIVFAVYLLVSMILYQTNPRIRAKEDAKPPQSTRIVQRVNQTVNHTVDHYFKKDTVKEEPADSLAPGEPSDADTLSFSEP
ncbi:MAG: LysE family translocator [Bacteroidales bacterium]|nr:LysE family translocator [Bacteroidales bacterium]